MYILQVFRMCRMVRKLRDFQDVSAQAERKDIVDLIVKDRMSMSKEGIHIWRDNLYLKTNDKDIIWMLWNGGDETWNRFPKEHVKNEEIIDRCIARGFIEQVFDAERQRLYVYLKPEGIDFCAWDYAFVDAMPKIGKFWGVLAIFLGGVALKEPVYFVFSTFLQGILTTLAIK